MRYCRGAWNGHYCWRALEQPGQRNLRGPGLMPLGNLVQWATWAGKFAGCQRKPGNKGQPFAPADVYQVFRGAVSQVVLILHRDNGDDLPRPRQLLCCNIGEANMANLAGDLQLCQCPKGILERYFGVGSVELIEINALQAQPFQAALQGCAQMRWPPIGFPLVRTWAH